jgi:kynureninase
MTGTDREHALTLDASDPLASFRGRFFVPDDDLVYLDGNSLGRPPLAALERVNQVMRDDWGTDLIGSWSHWQHLPAAVGDLLAPVIGARPGEVVAHDSTTVNLYQLVHAAAALRPERTTFVVEADEFPTDRYVVEGVADLLGKQVRAGVDTVDSDTALVVRSLVDYRSGEVADLHGATANARDAGANVIWDLSHAAGSIEVDLHAAGVELAVGCTYKYLNGGPGAPAFSFVATSLHEQLRQPMWGWFGQVDQFDMDAPRRQHPDARALLLGTPGILGLVAAQEGIRLTVEAGMPAIAAKGRVLTDLAVAVCDRLGLEVASPRDATRRGAHISVRHPEAQRLVEELVTHGVITDFRHPDLVRIGCSPLTTRFVDVVDGLECLARLV